MLSFSCSPPHNLFTSFANDPHRRRQRPASAFRFALFVVSVVQRKFSSIFVLYASNQFNISDRRCPFKRFLFFQFFVRFFLHGRRLIDAREVFKYTHSEWFSKKNKREVSFSVIWGCECDLHTVCQKKNSDVFYNNDNDLQRSQQ